MRSAWSRPRGSTRSHSKTSRSRGDARVAYDRDRDNLLLVIGGTIAVHTLLLVTIDAGGQYIRRHPHVPPPHIEMVDVETPDPPPPPLPPPAPPIPPQLQIQLPKPKLAAPQI